MNVFLLGATGHMGRSVAAALLGRGHTVVGLARSDEAARKLAQGSVDVHRGDLTDAESLRTGVARAEAVIHVAKASEWAVALSARDVLLAAVAGTAKPLVLTTGSNIYGDTGSAPATETSAPAGQVGQALAEYEEPARSRAVIIRPGFVYGDAGAPSIESLLRLTRLLGVGGYMGAGEQLWSFVHVEDLADLYVLALEQAPQGSVFNAAAEPPVRVRDLAAVLSRAAGLGGATRSLTRDEVVARAGERAAALLERNKWISAAKACRELGWKPTRPPVLV